MRALREVDADHSLDREHYLFVYGTLKRGMQWHDKFLARDAHFCGRATTMVRLRLTVGNCGVPYLLLPEDNTEPLADVEGRQIHGELWIVNDDTLLGMDQYEGIGKG